MADNAILVSAIGAIMILAEVIKSLVLRRRTATAAPSNGSPLRSEKVVEALEKSAENQGRFIEVARANGERIEQVEKKLVSVHDSLVVNSAKLEELLRR